jgi:hypothetical protein|tara:strand:- start:45441 stop:45986 length:546 start_codon:yes stop_codon:yes gene_type:complete
MKTMIKMFILTALTIGLFIIGCTKDEVNKGKMMVKMTDAPANFTQVNVEVQEIQVHYANNNNSNNGWVTLNTNTGIYNLLDLQNNVSVVIADPQDLSIGKITQMRLILGQQNTVVTTDSIYPLKLSSQDETGLKIVTPFSIVANKTISILVDFDAEQSIVIEGDGSFKLKPVIKIKNVEYY